MQDEMKYGRRAFGPYGRKSQASHAKDVALSIFCFQAKGVPRTFADYGIENNETMCQLVQDALTEIAEKRQAA